MKLSKERLEAYANKIGQTPERQINEYLSVNCESYKGNEDKLQRCITHLNSVVREISKAENGMAAVPDMVVFLVCQDYFNEEMWKAEDEEAAKAKKEAEERAAKAKAEKEAKAKKAEEKQKGKDNQLDLFGSETQAKPENASAATPEPSAEASPDAEDSDETDDEVVEEEEEEETDGQN